MARAEAYQRYTPRWARAPVPHDLRPLPLSTCALAPRHHPIQSLNDLRNHRIVLCNEVVDLGEPINWLAPSSGLARYELQYWDWAASIRAQHPEQREKLFFDYFTSWFEDNPFGSRVAWESYTVSRRAWAWFLWWQDQPSSQEVHALAPELARHYEFLKRNLERDLGGNHLITNLKALVALSISLDDDRSTKANRDEFLDAVASQILADGGHFERSPSYHVEVLSEVLDVVAVLAAAGHDTTRLSAIADSMKRWLAAMRLPSGGLPLFHDARDVDVSVLEALAPLQPRHQGEFLADSRFFIARNADAAVIADVGTPGAPSLPGHGHASALSFVLSVRGTPVIIDPGCSTYEPSATRDRERSTQLHNAVCLDGRDQMEVWGAFRVGKRPSVTVERVDPEANMISASHDGYDNLQGVAGVRRTIELRDGELVVTDEVAGTGDHEATLTYHLAPGVAVEHLTGSTVETSQCSIHFGREGEPEPSVRASESTVATDHNVTHPAAALHISAPGTLPLQLTTTVKWHR